MTTQTLKVCNAMSVTIEIDKDENTLRWHENEADTEMEYDGIDGWGNVLKVVHDAATQAGMEFVEGPDEYKDVDGWRCPAIQPASSPVA